MKEKIKIPIRVKIISEIKNLLIEIGNEKGIYVEKLVAEYMTKEGLSRRLILECITAIKYSGFATITSNGDKEKILKIKTNKEVQKDVI